MKSYIVDAWIRLRASYWFIPSVVSIGAILTAVTTVHLDIRFGDSWFRSIPWLLANQPAGARALLSTMAGSAITVAGVTFSMTLLAVSHASAQIGPRLLVDFMRDRGNQFTLGVFIATFLYCLMVLRSVHTGEAGNDASTAFVPHIAIMVAVVLAILNVIVLIYFIHHVPRSISVSNVIARVGDELARMIQTMYPEQVGERAEVVGENESLPDDFDSNSKELLVSDTGGYLRVLDADGLLNVAKENQLILAVKLRPGDFSLEGQSLMQVWPAQQLNEDIENSLMNDFSWGTERTREQDILFLVEQLAEILGKAMSPGVNGQYTALLCLDQFERALAELLRRRVPSSRRYDEEGRLRIIAEPVSHKEFLFAIILPIRQFVRGDWIVTRRVVSMLERLSELPALSGAKALLREASDLINEDIKSGPMAECEKRLLS